MTEQPVPDQGRADMPRMAMVLAAGRGTRLASIPDLPPKPLVRVGGKALIDHAVDMLAAAGVERVVVNTHHRAEAIEAHLAERPAPAIAVSREAELLDTGGGVRNALPLLGDAPFFVTNADLIWEVGSERALHRLASAWDPARMDALLLLYPTVRTFGYSGQGDFLCDQLGKLRRRPEWAVAPYIYTGVQLVHPRLFAQAPAGAFSFNRLWDQAEAAERLYGIIHDGIWLDAGTPARLEQARAEMGEAAQGRLF
ncbi:MAG: nucleotidyltransferase family protein [Alphaproteobacteria bacterium]